MNPNRLKPKDEELMIADMIESEIPRHHQYHRHICNFKMLLEIFTRNKSVMGLSELKGIMRSHWAKHHNHISEKERFLLWYCHFMISKMLVKQRKENDLKPHDVARGFSHTPLQNLRDINDYYAFAGVVLMALKETDIATIIGCTAAKLSRILEQQIPGYYSACQTS